MINLDEEKLPAAEENWRIQMADLGFPISVEGHAVHSSHLTSATGDYHLAYEYCVEFTQASPNSILAWSALATLCQRLGRPQWAACRRRIAELSIAESEFSSADQTAIVEFYLACEGASGSPTEQAPNSYIKALFDGYAAEFDEQLLGELKYTGHVQLMAAVDRHVDRSTLHSILDLGCGTGLLGSLLQTNFPDASCVGIDLSKEMLTQAARKQVYDELVEADIEAYLRPPGKFFDLVTAADVFTYIGDLQAVFEALFKRLSPGGLFAFTALLDQNCETFRTSPTRDFRHSPEYVASSLEKVGLKVVQCTEINLREHLGIPVQSMIYVAKRDID